jgi:DNA-binding FadR family transcriptional regulator
MSEAIVGQIRELILAGRLRPGDRLPSERELGEHLAASRVTVREALRVLETAGLVYVRVGARGGTYITQPTADRVGAELADALRHPPVSAGHVTEARLVFELGIVPLVVERATIEDVEDLRRLAGEQVAALRHGEYQPSRSARFHIRVGACAHNAAIDTLMNTFYGPLVMSLHAAKDKAPLAGEYGAYEHRDFAEAVATRNGAEALVIMDRHITRTARRLASARAGAPEDLGVPAPRHRTSL